MTPPDGHWHRRTDKPVKVTDTTRIYGCTHSGCTWQVIVDKRRRERQIARSTAGDDL